MADIGIIGYGVVGKAVGDVFEEKGHKVTWCDRNEGTLEDVVNNSEFIFATLPTPANYEKEKIDLSIIEDVVSKVTPMTDNTDKLFIIKSTVVPGTTRSFAEQYPHTNFLFNPEFLTAANPAEDFRNQDRIVIGGQRVEDTLRLFELYAESFPGVPIYQTNTTAAEMAKYMANTFLATKVIFANEMYDICNTIGVDYDMVKSMVMADHRIGTSHWDVTAERGFSGMCFPKDVVALLGKTREYDGLDTKLLDTVWEKNKEIRKNHDWLDHYSSNAKKKD